MVVEAAAVGGGGVGVGTAAAAVAVVAVVVVVEEKVAAAVEVVIESDFHILICCDWVRVWNGYGLGTRYLGRLSRFASS